MTSRAPAFLLASAALASAATAATPFESVRLETSCEAMNPDYCVGLYGFTVKSDGSWLAGPDDKGLSTGGKVSSRELRRLSGLIRPVIDAGVRCEAEPVIPGVSRHVSAMAADKKPRELARLDESNRTCYAGGKRRGSALASYLETLAAKYYPRPFSGNGARRK